MRCLACLALGITSPHVVTPSYTRLPTANTIKAQLEWINPLYWPKALAAAKHLASAVPPHARLLELANDAKAIYYYTTPKEITVVTTAPASEPPFREAAAKANVPSFALFADGSPIDTLPLKAGHYDAAVCTNVLDDAPREAAQAAVDVLARCLRPGGRLVWVSSATVDVGSLAAGASLVPLAPALPYAVEEGGVLLGVALKPADAPVEAGALVSGGSRASRRRAERDRGKRRKSK